MTPAERARASRAAQGLPAVVTDVATLRRVAALVAAATRAPAPCAGCPERKAAA